MCQMRVVLQKSDQQEKVMDNIARLEITPEGILISAMFDQPKLLAGTVLKQIDFMDGIVTLEPTPG